MTSHPNLDPPGQGIPTIERWIGGRLILPYYQWRYSSWQQARQFLLSTLARFIQTAASCPAETAEVPVLIDRLSGLEDSSRYWSVAQVVEHLAIVDAGIADALPRLAKGESEFQLVSTAAVKPQGKTGMQEAQRLLDSAQSKLMSVTEQPLFSKATLTHPWFGPLTAKQWLVMSGMHHTIHQKQLTAILQGIPERP